MMPSVANHPLFANVRRSPYFDRTEAAGAVAYMAYNHMYMAMDYGRQPARRVPRADRGRDALGRRGGAAGRAGRARRAGRSPTGSRRATCRSSQPGACRYTLIADENGIVICDPVVLHVEEGRVWLSHGNVDLLLWAKGVALGAGLDVTGARGRRRADAAAGAAGADGARAAGRRRPSRASATTG